MINVQEVIGTLGQGTRTARTQKQTGKKTDRMKLQVGLNIS
jgi:hypothetical protein